MSLCPTASQWVDVDAFEQAAALARQRQDLPTYRAALELYTGDLLPEDPYEAWAGDRRESLRLEYLALLSELARLAEARGEHTVAITTLQQVLVRDPADEAAHQSLMRLYARTGARQHALRQYRLLRQALQQELEVEPDARSHRLHQDILAGRFEAEEVGRTQEDSPAARRSPPRLHNLPVPLTTFIGREREIVDVRHLLARARLLTLAGPGGCGKTRLALEVARAVCSLYPDGVWLVELGALADPALVPQAAARALGVREVAGQSVTETLVAALEAKQLMLVLDNCEHLVAACAQLAETLLRRCPTVHLLATSREPLHIPGEISRLVPPLALPDPARLPPLDELRHCAAIRLFTERATAALPSFALTRDNAPVLAQICRWLDGLPLALELAAARMPVLTVEQLAERLDDRFRLLTAGSRTALTRQQTLRGTLDWSYALLLEGERVVFRRLAVFAGGWTLEAAEAICAGDGLEPAEVFTLVAALVDKSLVVAAARDQQYRYHLLETVRQYALEQLRAADEAAAVGRRHLDWYLRLAEQAAPELSQTAHPHWFERLEREHDNLRAALAWSLTEAGDLGAGLQLACALIWFRYLGSYLTEGRAWFDAALARVAASDRTRATALYGTGVLAAFQGDLAVARPRLAESVALWREVGEVRGLADALFGLSVVAVNQGDDRTARPQLEECLGLWRALGHRRMYASTLMNLGDVALAHGDAAAAHAAYAEALAIHRELGNMWGIAQGLNNLGEVARYTEAYSRAGTRYAESLALFQALGTNGDIARSLHNLAHVAHAQGEDDRAQALFTESLALFQARGTRRGIVECLAGLAEVALTQEPSTASAVRAARLLGGVEAQLAGLGAALWPADRRAFERTVATIQGLLDAEAFARAWAAGRALTLEQLIVDACPPTGGTR